MSTFEIKMPKLGESITEGTIVSWSVKVGDAVQEDDVLFEVSTAKVSAEIPSPVAGKVLELLFAEGDTVAVGTAVALIQLEGEEGETQESSASAAAKSDDGTVHLGRTRPAGQIIQRRRRKVVFAHRVATGTGSQNIAGRTGCHSGNRLRRTAQQKRYQRLYNDEEKRSCSPGGHRHRTVPHLVTRQWRTVAPGNSDKRYRTGSGINNGW